MENQETTQTETVQKSNLETLTDLFRGQLDAHNQALRDVMEQLSKAQEQLTKHEETHKNFRQSFLNLENLFTQLKDRNHLR